MSRESDQPPIHARDVIRSLDIDLREAPALLWRVIKLVLRYRGRFAFATACSLGATCFNMMVPGLLGHAVDEVHMLLRQGHPTPGAAVGVLGSTALLILGASVLRGGLQMAAGYSSERIGQSVARDLRLAFFEKLQRLGFDFHDRIHSGDLITRGMLDLEGVRGFIENGMQRLISLILLLGVGSALLFSEDPVMALLALSFVPIAAWRAANMGLRLRLAWTRLQEKLSVLTRVMEENLQGVRAVRAFASQRFEMAKFDESGNAALVLANERIVIRAGSMAVINSSYYLAMALVLWVGGHRVAAGAITIGQLTQFLAFMTILQLPVRQIGMIMNSSARAISSGRRVFEVLDLEPTIRDAPGARPLAAGEGVLRFEEASFAYGADAPLALDRVSFSVGPGKTLGIVGPSGSGKSTIAQLIPRFYDVSAGRITIDGQDVRGVTLDSLRAAIGLVQQDVFLFDDSISSNIAYADPNAGDDALRNAAGVSQMHDYIAGLPSGYATPVGERGSSLSGGQRQRLSIARGMVPDPAILVFDDVTSAVDAATEHRLRAALRNATDHRATIIISHRLGSLIHADEILVLDAGRVVERGTHAELMARGGYYATLHRLQSQPGDRPSDNVADDCRRVSA
ncbi:MAG TPA: ABC transporter ATP-binding protein [Novosphingobium sp.]